MATRPFLARHGQTVANVSGERLYNPELTELGWEQSRRLADALAAAGVQRIVSSPLVRALQTASCLAEKSGAPLHAWNDLVEYNRWDPYTGAGRQSLAARFPRAVLESDMPDGGWTYPGPESEAAVAERVRRVTQRLAALPDGTCIAIVAHGTLNARLLLHWLGAAGPVGIAQDNACINALRLENRLAWLERINDTSHLA